MSQLIFSSNALYPARLREVRPAVPALYVRGELRVSDWHGVAIIGARHPYNAAAQARAERIASISNSNEADKPTTITRKIRPCPINPINHIIQPGRNQRIIRQIKLDRDQIAELSRRMATLSIQSEAPIDMTSTISGKQKYSTILHMVMDYYTLCGGHIKKLAYWHLTPKCQAHYYYMQIPRLIEHGWMERERIPERKDYAYSLGKWGRMLAQVNGRKAGNRRILRGHDLLTADFMTESLHRARRMGVEAWWESEVEARLTDQLRPDALLKLATNVTQLDSFIETDTGSETLGIFAQKHDKYLDYSLNGDWRQRFQRDTFPVVLVIIKGKWDRLAGMRAAINERMVSTATKLRFYFTTEEDLYWLINKASSPGPVHEPIWLAPDDEESHTLWQLLCPEKRSEMPRIKLVCITDIYPPCPMLNPPPVDKAAKRSRQSAMPPPKR